MHRRRVWTMLATRLRWVSITPFDSPVVPDEYGSTTTSSRSTGTCSASGSPKSDDSEATPVGLADHEQLLHRRVLHRLGGDLEEHRDGDQPRGPGVDELMVHLARGVGRVDRRDHAAGQRDGVEHHAVLGAVRRHDRQHLALGQPGGQEAAGEATDGVVELGVGHRAPRRTVDEGGAIASRLASARTNGVRGTSGMVTSGSGLVKVTARPVGSS